MVTIEPGREPLVSVVVPTHNRPELLRRAIGSVLRQTYANLKLIVVDDASTGQTSEVVRSFADDRIRYLRHETTRHASAARNTGIQESRGKYIAFLDDDDEWLPSKLEEQVGMMETAPPEVGMLYCWLDYYEDGKIVREHHPNLRGNVFGLVLDHQRLGNSSTLLVRRGVVDQVGGFDESLPRGNDGDFIRRVCLKYQVDLVPRVLVRVHVGHGFGHITSSDTQGIRNAIRSQTVKLTKFKDLLPKYPQQTAAIFSTIAYHYSQLGDWRNSAAFYLRSIKTAPFSPRVYLRLLRPLKDRIAIPRFS